MYYSNYCSPVIPNVYCQVAEMAKQLIDGSSDSCQVMKKLKNILSCGTAIIDAFLKYELVFRTSSLAVILLKFKSYALQSLCLIPLEFKKLSVCVRLLNSFVTYFLWRCFTG